MFGLKLKKFKVNDFHPLEVVARGSEAQFQVGGNLNKVS